MAVLNESAAPALQIGEDPADTYRKAEIVHGEIVDAASGETTRRLIDGRKYTIKIRVKAHEDIPLLSVGFDIRTQTGVQVYGYSTGSAGIPEMISSGALKDYLFSLPAHLNNGSYFLNLGIAEQFSGADDPHHYSIIQFIADSIVIEGMTKDLFPGLINMNSEFLGSSNASQ